MDHKEIFKKLGIKTFAETEDEIRIMCPSPAHQDNRPSCSYNKNKKVWFCHGCNAKGTLKKLFYDKGLDVDIHAYETPESLLKQLHELNDQPPEDEVYLYFRKEFKRIENKTDCPHYLSQRLKMDTVQKFNLYVCHNESPIDRNRIIIPIVNDKNLSFVARDYTETADKKYVFPNGMPKSKFLFGNFKSETVILTEGVFDVMKMWEYGFENCIAILGANLSQYQSQKLVEAGVKRLILYPDGDQGGVKLMKDCLKQHVFFDLEVMLSKWGQDPSDMSEEEVKLAYNTRINYHQLNQQTTKSPQIDNMQESLKKISNW